MEERRGRSNSAAHRIRLIYLECHSSMQTLGLQWAVFRAVIFFGQPMVERRGPLRLIREVLIYMRWILVMPTRRLRLGVLEPLVVATMVESIGRTKRAGRRTIFTVCSLLMLTMGQR